MAHVIKDSIKATSGISVGGATPGTGGIAFPATAVAVADANTLDDYEEGTWTPVLGGGGGESGQTYTVQNGNYTKIGNFVYCRAYVTLSAKGTITSGLQLKGFPFTASGQGNSGAIAYHATFSLGGKFPLLSMGSGTAVGYFYQTSYTADTPATITTAHIADGVRLDCSISYYI